MMSMRRTGAGLHAEEMMWTAVGSGEGSSEMASAPIVGRTKTVAGPE